MIEDNLQHIIVTRFNCRFGTMPKHLTFQVPTAPNWLDDRFDLFEKYCAPSLHAQTQHRFQWFVYFDQNTPPRYLQRAERALGHRANMHVKLCEAFTIEKLREDIRSATPTATQWLLTTRLDNDDGLGSNFVERLQVEVDRTRREALNFPLGLVFGSSKLFSSVQGSNAFLSVSEPYDDDFKTVHWGSHNDMASRMPVRDVGSERPAWLQIIHGGNVSNKLRGRRILFDAGKLGFVPLERMMPSEYTETSKLRLMIENASISSYWSLRDQAVKRYRQARRALRPG